MLLRLHIPYLISIFTKCECCVSYSSDINDCGHTVDIEYEISDIVVIMNFIYYQTKHLVIRQNFVQNKYDANSFIISFLKIVSYFKTFVGSGVRKGEASAKLTNLL